MYRHPTIHRGLYSLHARMARAVALATVVGFAVSASATAHAQASYPTKPIKLVVGFAPGGPTDKLFNSLAGTKLMPVHYTPSVAPQNRARFPLR